MRLFHLSDLHIGVNSRLGVDGHKNEVMRHLKGVLETAQKEGVDFVVFAGDVFDSNAVPTSFVMEFFETLAGFSDVNFVIIPGGGAHHEGEVTGHDAYTSDSVYRRVDVVSFVEGAGNIFLLTPDKPSVKVKDAAFYAGFFGYPRSGVISDAFYHIAVLHGAFGKSEDRGEEPIDPMVDKYHYIALGHYHGFKRLADNAAYSGAFVQFEFLPHRDAVSGYVAVELGGGKPLVEHRVLEDAPCFVRMEVKAPEDVEEIERLLESGARVRLISYFDEYRDAVSKLKRSYKEFLEVADGAEISGGDFGFADVLDEVISEAVPYELAGDVKELLLYGLRIASKRGAKRDLELFLREHFGF